MTAPILSGLQAPEDLVELGRVSGAYGIRGWIRVHPYSSESKTLLDVTRWWLKAPAPVSGAGVLPLAQQVVVQNSRVHGAAVVARLADIVDRTQAEAFKGFTVWVSRSDFPLLEHEEYYWVDLVGCKLYGEDAGKPILIGEVIDVMDNGAHGVLRVGRLKPASDGSLVFQNDAKGRPVEVLVPFVAAHVHTVDLKNRQLHSNWPAE